MLLVLHNTKQKKKSPDANRNRILISVTVLGSAGPIRFLVYEDDPVVTVIDTAIKCYAREGRLPVLGTEIMDFLLYSPVAGDEALKAWNTIGSLGTRNFMLCKKPEVKKQEDVNERSKNRGRKGNGGSLRAWINKSFNLKVPSH